MDGGGDSWDIGVSTLVSVLVFLCENATLVE